MADRFSLEAELRDLDRFFLPANGEPALAPGMQGPACTNLRHALSMLGHSITFGDVYDDDTSEAVREFQRKNGHRHDDGVCGEGTRRLLIRVLLKSKAKGFFARAPDPEGRSIGHAFLSYARKDSRLVQDYEGLISGWGFTPWRDQSSIPGGADWSEEIRIQIGGSYLLLAFATPAFLKSDMCKTEVEGALAKGKPTLVVQHTAVPSSHWLHPVVQSKQWIAKPPNNPRNPRATDFRKELRRAIHEAQRRGRATL